MHSDDFLRSDEAVTFFKECLREQGLTALNVSHQITPENFTDEFYIRKQLGGGEELVYKSTLNLGNNSDPQYTKKRLAIEAESVAKKFKEQLVTTLRYDTRRIQISPYDGGWAKCYQCDTRVEAPRISSFSTRGCELSHPIPRDRDISSEFEGMEEHQKVLVKMYLVGILREECDEACPNSKYNADSNRNRKI
jgi:hypothetical protein